MNINIYIPMCMFIYEYDFVYGEVEEVYKSIFLHTNSTQLLYTSLENA